MVGPQTANREKKNPPENEFRRVGMCCRDGRIERLLPIYGITHAVYQLSTVCILKRKTWEPGMAGVLKWYKIVPTSCTL